MASASPRIRGRKGIHRPKWSVDVVEVRQWWKKSVVVDDCNGRGGRRSRARVQRAVLCDSRWFAAGAAGGCWYEHGRPSASPPSAVVVTMVSTSFVTLVFLVCLQTVLLSTVSNCAKTISMYWNTTNSM